MENNKAAGRPAVKAGFLVSILVFILFLCLISFSGCDSKTRAQQKPHSLSDPAGQSGEISDEIRYGAATPQGTGYLQRETEYTQGADTSQGNETPNGAGVPNAAGTPSGTITPEGSKIPETPPEISYREDEFFSDRHVRAGVTLENVDISGMGRFEVEELVIKLAKDIEREPKNAEINKNWTVSDSELGVKVDREKTVSRAMQADEGSKVTIAVIPIEPVYTQKQLQEGLIEISGFTTPIIDKSPGRVNNIRLAAKQIDCYILSPGKEFSFNKIVGRTTASEGYQKAIIIGKDNKREYEVGGGICQLSTTLYNAAVKAGLKVTERHPHTKNVPYIAPGKDAMVNDGNADMRFVNNRNYPVMVRSEIGSNYVKTWLLENRN